MEQDRAPHVQLRQPQLARPTAREPQIIVDLIAATTTNTGLKVYARLDDGNYERGIEITDEQLATVNITRHEFHGDWNYTVIPSDTQS